METKRPTRGPRLKYSRDELLELRYTCASGRFDHAVYERVLSLGILRRRRGHRAGRRKQRHISIVIGHRFAKPHCSDIRPRTLVELPHLDETIATALGKEGKILSFSENGKPAVRVGGEKVVIHPGLLEFQRQGMKSDSDSDDDDEDAKKSGDSSDDEDMSSELALLIAAANDGTASTVKNMLDENPQLVNQKYKGTAPVHVASSSGIEVLKVTVEAGGKVDLRDKKSSTPLQYAAEGDKHECIQYLLEKGADVNAANVDKYTALHAAAKEGNVESARLLLQNGMRVNAKEKNGMTAFHLTAVKGFVQCAELLVEFGCDVNTQDRHGDTPAHDAAMHDSEAFHVILEHPKFDPKITNKKGFNVLQYAALRDRERILTGLVKKFPDMVNMQKGDGFTALHVAVLNGHLKCIEILFELGKCDINRQNAVGQTPVHLAVDSDHMPELEYLLAIGAEVNVQDIFGKAPLHLAASNFKEGKSMTETPTLKEIRSKYKKFGVVSNAAAVVCLLVQNGADITVKEKLGKTPLSYIDNKNLQDLLERLSKGEKPEEDEPDPTAEEDTATSDQPRATVIEGLHRISISEITTEKVLGRGSFGLVTKATWRGTPVAVKAIPIDVAVKERVEQQLSVHRQTTHPNIVELMALSFDPEKTEILIVMEYIDGKSLHDVIFPVEGKVQISRMDKVNISKQILQAISFIHRSRILHLNIKPANVLLDTKTKKPYLSDLGLAHMNFSSDEGGREETGFDFQGTVYYIPPEGVRMSEGGEGRTDQFTPAYDIWSLGGTLLEMFTEKELWGDDVEIFFVIAQLLQGKARPPIIDDVEAPVRAILEPCFAHNPEDRPTAAKLVSQFQNLS